MICGYDAGARMLLNAILEEIDPEVTRPVIFAAGERPRDVPAEFTWISGDPTKESELDKGRISHASAAIIVGSRAMVPQQADATTILTVFTIRRYLQQQPRTELRVRPLYIVAEILDAENVEHALSAGADEVIETNRLGFSLLSHAIVMRGSGAIMSRVVSSGAHSLYVGCPPDQPQTYGELRQRVRAETGALVIGLRDSVSGRDTLNPADDFQVTSSMQIIYLAEKPVLPEV
jgi:voltage-gated potassium channel